MGQKATSFLSVAFYLLFGLLFSSLVLLLVVKSDAPILALLTVTAVLVLMALFYQFLGKHEDFLEKCYPVLLAGFLICSGIIQLASANMLRFQPVADLGAIYHGAIEWVETGTFASYSEYYQVILNITTISLTIWAGWPF